MKIVCDNCATKYQIADEKVSGKAFKIRCKKCGHVIVVNKGPGEAGGQAPAPEPSVNAEAAPPAAEAAPAGDAVWHLVIDREQVGPMNPDEVRGKVRSGQVDAETYGWREGFDDWLKLSAIPDFKALFPAGDDQATRRTDGSAGAAPAAQAPPGSDLFGGKDEPIRTANPGAATIVSDGMQAPDLAALGLTPSHQAPQATIAEPMPAPQIAQQYQQEPASAPMSAGGMDAPVKSMTGARSENSVLFSLNNLSALAGASGGGGGGGGGRGGGAAKADAGGGGGGNFPSPQSEASGLIDIRAMAAATLGAPGGGPSGVGPSHAPDFLTSDAPPVFTPLAPAVLMPTNEPSGVPKWVFALVGVGVLMFIGMIVTLVVVLREPSNPPVVTNTPGKDTTGPGTKEPGTSPTKEPGTTSTKEPGTSSGTSNSKPSTTESPSTKPASEKSSEKPSKSSGGSHKDKEPRESKSKETKEKPEKGGPELAPIPTKTEPAAPKPAPKPKAKDDLDSLLDNASSGSGGKPKAAEKEDLPEQLSMSDIQKTLKGVNVASCKDQGASGVIQIKLTIGKSGAVSSASPSGGGAGADCVAGKVKSAKFGKFSGDPMTLTYPFIVR